MASNKPQVGLRLECKDLQKMHIIAKRDGRSFNNLVATIIKDYIEKYEIKNGPIATDYDD